MTQHSTILITGADGQLGTELRHFLTEQGQDFIATDRDSLDITDAEAVVEFFAKTQPSVVYHCAAYTAVDQAEDEGKDLNWQINVTGTQNIADAAAQVGATLVYISTDYVFGGHLPVGREWEVDDPKNPESEYGRAKLAGEKAVADSDARSYVIRTAWVYGNYGANFVFTMQRLGADRDRLTVVNDQHGRPTWTRTLAEFMVYLVDNGCPLGVYQLTNDAAPGEDITWFDFAREILKNQPVTVAPVDSTQFPQKAKRPFNSTMSLAKAKATGFQIPPWQAALRQMLQAGDKRL